MIQSIFAGILIGLGCVVYVCTPDHYVGSFLFSLGLITVVLRQYNLFTGKVGFVNNPREFLGTLVMFVGNAIGAAIVGVCVGYTRMGLDGAHNIVATKLNDNPLSAFILSIGCGIMMYLAVSNYKKKENLLLIIMPIMIFILCGFEHCIANVCYFAMTGEFTLKAMLYIFIMVSGNAVGSLLFKFENIGRNK